MRPHVLIAMYNRVSNASVTQTSSLSSQRAETDSPTKLFFEWSYFLKQLQSPLMTSHSGTVFGQRLLHAPSFFGQLPPSTAAPWTLLRIENETPSTIKQTPNEFNAFTISRITISFQKCSNCCPKPFWNAIGNVTTLLYKNRLRSTKDVAINNIPAARIDKDDQYDWGLFDSSLGSGKP